MLKKLRIQNFKVWEDTGEIAMAPITLFFGANSSGKSSIGQFLMMLKQTVESRSHRETVFYSGYRNSAVQLGSYEEMVFQHNSKKMIEFEYQWSPNWSPIDFIKIKHVPYRQKFSDNDRLAFQAKIGATDLTQTTRVNLFKYELIKNGKISRSLGMKLSSGARSVYEVESSGFDLKERSPGIWRWPMGEPKHFCSFSSEVFWAYTNIRDFATEFEYLHEELFSALFYLGPLRAKTERSYYYTGGKLESVGYEGEDTIATILEARSEGRRIKLPEKHPARSFEEVIALKLKDMGLIEEFEIQTVSQRVHEVKIRTKGSRTWVDLPDVGFGISQVLPVLVQCFYAPEGSIILIDQPEVHLHPYAQSALADVMIDAITSQSDLGEGFRDRNIQLIIETHSEHFLRRLQRRIAEGRLPRDKVSAYFANINDPPAKLERLEIDEFGNIQNWPENFFGDEMGDILAQAEAAMEKRMQTDQKS